MYLRLLAIVGLVTVLFAADLGKAMAAPVRILAFGDSLTAKRAQVVNQHDHAQAPRLLRDVLGNLLPDGQERRYRRILSFKDEAQYGTRQALRDEATRLLADLEEFARWTEGFF